MNQQAFCQSCAMPLGADPALYGTNADGSQNTDYCIYCYAGGAYTVDCTMAEMIEQCVPHMTAANQGMTADQARQMMAEYFPTLKRWAKA